MSMIMMAKAFGIKVGNAGRKLVLLKLADNANDSGECWPSYQHIADHCEISRRSAMNHIEALCRAGLVTKVSRKGPKGNATNTYLLNLDGGEKSAPPTSGGETDSLGGETDSLGGETVAPGGGETVAPGISHSSEPVSEPVKEPSAASQDADDLSDAFELFWRAGMRKANRKAACKAFESAAKGVGMAPAEFAQMLAGDIAKRIAAEQLGFDRMHPTTYLNGERWEDDLPPPPAQTNSRPGRAGFAQPKPTGSYLPTDNGMPQWAEKEKCS